MWMQPVSFSVTENRRLKAKGKKEEGERTDMKVTYIHHSSFAVELDRAVLLFDYFEGALPEFPEEKPLIIFASHFHADHYGPVIFDLAGSRERVCCILSADIRKKVPEEWADRVFFVKPGRIIGVTENLEVRDLGPGAGCRQNTAGGEMDEGENCLLTAETLHSTDEGCAFWISCGGTELYHAGDLNNWWWEGEDKAWNHNMAASYGREMKKLAGRRAAAAFIPVDPRLGEAFYLGAAGFMEQADAEYLFPMHFWGEFGVAGRLIAHPASAGWRDRIVRIQREGEEFEL